MPNQAPVINDQSADSYSQYIENFKNASEAYYSTAANTLGQYTEPAANGNRKLTKQIEVLGQDSINKYQTFINNHVKQPLQDLQNSPEFLEAIQRQQGGYQACMSALETQHQAAKEKLEALQAEELEALKSKLRDTTHELVKANNSQLTPVEYKNDVVAAQERELIIRQNKQREELDNIFNRAGCNISYYYNNATIALAKIQAFAHQIHDVDKQTGMYKGSASSTSPSYLPPLALWNEMCHVKQVESERHFDFKGDETTFQVFVRTSLLTKNSTTHEVKLTRNKKFPDLINISPDMTGDDMSKDQKIYFLKQTMLQLVARGCTTISLTTIREMVGEDIALACAETFLSMCPNGKVYGFTRNETKFNNLLNRIAVQDNPFCKTYKLAQPGDEPKDYNPDLQAPKFASDKLDVPPVRKNLREIKANIGADAQKDLGSSSSPRLR